MDLMLILKVVFGSLLFYLYIRGGVYYLKSTGLYG